MPVAGKGCATMNRDEARKTGHERCPGSGHSLEKRRDQAFFIMPSEATVRPYASLSTWARPEYTAAKPQRMPS